jgi:hypothetical protein
MQSARVLENADVRRARADGMRFARCSVDMQATRKNPQIAMALAQVREAAGVVMEEWARLISSDRLAVRAKREQVIARLRQRGVER